MVRLSLNLGFVRMLVPILETLEVYITPLKWIEYGVYGDLLLIYPIYLRGLLEQDMCAGV